MTPWSTYPPGGRPIWEFLGPLNDAVLEHFEELAAIMEHEAGMSRGRAELFAYAFLVRRLVLAGVVPKLSPSECNVVVQLDRAERIDRDFEFCHSIGVRP